MIANLYVEWGVFDNVRKCHVNAKSTAIKCIAWSNNINCHRRRQQISKMSMTLDCVSNRRMSPIIGNNWMLLNGNNDALMSSNCQTTAPILSQPLEILASETLTFIADDYLEDAIEFGNNAFDEANGQYASTPSIGMKTRRIRVVSDIDIGLNRGNITSADSSRALPHKEPNIAEYHRIGHFEEVAL